MRTETIQALAARVDGEEGLNLDGLQLHELTAFYLDVLACPEDVADLLFPSKPEGHYSATLAMADYAQRMAEARAIRVDRGGIGLVLAKEQAAERIYNRLPEFAKW